jgi:hypothetical protein
MIGERLLRKPIKLSGLRVSFDLFIKLNSVRFSLLIHIVVSRTHRSQYFAEIGNSSAGNSVITRQPLSVTTTSSSMRAAE